MRFLSAFALACVLLSVLAVLGSAKEAGSTRGGLSHLQRAVKQSQLEPHSLVATHAAAGSAAAALVGDRDITVANDEEDPDLLQAIRNEWDAEQVVAQRGRVANFLTAEIIASARAPAQNGFRFLELDVAVQTQAEAETQVQAQTETETEASTAVSVGAYPVTTLAGAGSCGALRVQVQADPVPLAHNGFVYTYDAAAAGLTLGRINSASGTITAPITTRPAKAAAVEWCDVLFRPTALPFQGVAGTRNQAPGGGRRLWQSGHIIAHSLGGSSDHSINFYPQHRSSNNQGGRWGKIEAIALRVAANCPAGTVAIDVTFNAWDPANGVAPMGGNYIIIIQPACQAFLGAGCANGVAAPGGWHAYLRTFCRHATAMPGAPLGWRRFVTQFSNDANDVIGAAGRADAHFFP